MLQAKFPDATVINAGISGHNTSDEFKQLVNLFPVYQQSCNTGFLYK